MEKKVGHILFFVFTFILATKSCSKCQPQTQPKPQVPCLFIFGDSLVDNGNNNDLLTLSRANYYPYGIDFPQGVTGRFTNGLTYVDYLAQLLGFSSFIPPFSSIRGKELLRGANFASGAAGIREETGNNLVFFCSDGISVEYFIFFDFPVTEATFIHQNSSKLDKTTVSELVYLHSKIASMINMKPIKSNDCFLEPLRNYGDHTSMSKQVAKFGTAVDQLRRYFKGDNKALGKYLSKCIFYSGMGSNDYLNNYFMPTFYTTGSNYTPQAYANSLIQDYSKQLTVLYNLGARKVAVTGVGQIGCIPYQLARLEGNSSSRCNEEINNAILLFNSGLRRMVDRFNKALHGTKFTYLDSYESSNDLVVNAKQYGFEVIDKGCCGVGRNNGQITCLPLQQPCDDRSKYLFWDAFHPTDAANMVLAKKSFMSNSKSNAYPVNIQMLATI